MICPVHRAFEGSIAFKRQVVQEYLAGETLHGLARRHNPSRTLIRIWVDKHGAGTFDEGAEAENTIQEYEARIAALGYLSPNRFEEEQLHKPVKSAA